MSTSKQFFLPDLGEGLPDAEIVEWLVKEGESVLLDQPLVSMETAKAVVEVPSPFSGTLIKQHGKAGDVIDTGAAIASFELDMSKPQRAEAADTGHQHGGGKAHASAAHATVQDDYLPASVAGSSHGTPSPPTPLPAGEGNKSTLDPSVRDSAPQTSPASGRGSQGRADEGTVVGAMQSSNEVKQEQLTSIGGVKAMPAVRALAKKLGVDLARVKPTGPHGTVSLQDVKAFAAKPSSATVSANAAVGAASVANAVVGAASVANAVVGAASAANAVVGSASAANAVAKSPSADSTPGATASADNSNYLTPAQRRALLDAQSNASGATVSTPAPVQTNTLQASTRGASPKPDSTVYQFDQAEALRGVRRNMVRVMAQSHAEVVPTTIVDDADIHRWDAKQDITVRLIRALVAACKAVPALNAWFDGANASRLVHSRVDVGIAVDTDDGLFVPALRNADVLDAAGLRAAINRLRDAVRNRSIPADELKGYTIMLSNFGVFAGRYATPVVVPPCVCIVASGKLRHEVVPVMGGIETHRMIPLSLTFDHRAVTGGEAAKFLRVMLDDLALAS